MINQTEETVVGEYGWKELAAELADEHASFGSAALFIYSGAPLWIYGGRLRVVAEEEKMTTFEGKVIKRKDIRQFLWEQKLRKDDPAEVPKNWVLWSMYDTEHNRSFLGLGHVKRVPREEVV